MRGVVVYNTILVIINRYLKIALYFLVLKIITAVETADLLIDSVFTRFRFPNSIISDRDLRFILDF